MKSRLYTLLKTPYKDSDGQHHEAVVLNVLIIGTLVFLGLAAIVSGISFAYSHDPAVEARIFSTSAFFLFTAVLYVGAHLRKWPLLLTARLLVAFYVLIVAIILFWLGTTNPTGLLLAGFIIPLAGILLGARYALSMVMFITLLVIIATIQSPPEGLAPTMVVLRCIILAGMYVMMGLISWLFIRAVQFSQARAKRYEQELILERDSLEIKVRERTRELEAAQLEKLQQRHRFAELGYISTATLHDLANHVSAISLDAETLEKQVKSPALQRMKQNLSYIEDDVIKAREFIRGERNESESNLQDEIAGLVRILRYNQGTHGVSIEQAAADNTVVRWHGNTVGFRQVLSGLIMNAVESYDATEHSGQRRVVVEMERNKRHIKITVTDYGRGIAADELSHIFDPFYSTKRKGMGMGLYIAKQVVEQELHGELSVESVVGKGTTVTLTIRLA